VKRKKAEMKVEVEEEEDEDEEEKENEAEEEEKEEEKEEEEEEEEKEEEEEEKEEEEEEENEDDEDDCEADGEEVKEDVIDDIVVMDEDEQPAAGHKGSIKVEIIEANPLPNSPAETVEEKLAKLAQATAKVYNWMAGIERNQIEETIGDWDKLSLLKIVEMADSEIQEHPEKFV
jgi:hypothetical protein